MTETRVLVAEDDPRQAEMIRRYLVSAGHEVSVTHDGEQALRVAGQIQPDVVVLDVMMPGLDGLSVCRQLRARSDVLIVMLTARSTEEDLLAGLDLGADDYLTKPYSPRELVARIRTLLRRVPATRPGLRVGPLSLDREQQRLTVDGQEIECTAGEFAILLAMAQYPGRVFSRAQLLQHTQGINRSSTERTIDVHVMNLRRKIEPDPTRPRFLRTVYGVGYRLQDDRS